MNKKGLVLVNCIGAIALTAPVAYADGHRSGGMARPSMTRSASRFAPSGIRPSGNFQRWNGNWSGRNVRWTQSTMGRNGAMVRSGNWTGRNGTWTHNSNWTHNGNWNHNGDWHRHHHHDNFVFFSGFGFPWYYPYYDYYPYSYYYPYGYDGYYPQDYYYDNGPNSGSYYGGTYNGRGAYGRNGGQENSVVARVQEALARDGYYKSQIDGVAGDRTFYAIRAYERDHHLRVDGAISDQLLNEMGLR